MDTTIIVVLVCVALAVAFIAWIKINSGTEASKAQEDQAESGKNH